MAKVYCSLCIKGLRNFNDIDKSLQPEVKKLLKAEGYIVNKNGTVTKKKE